MSLCVTKIDNRSDHNEKLRSQKMEIHKSTVLENLLKKSAINLVAIECFKKGENVDFPTPGIEPGPPG